MTYLKVNVINSCSKSNAYSALSNLRRKYPLKVSSAFLNINSARNKLNNLFTFLNNDIDIIVIGETKLDSSFVTNQFLQEGFNTPFRRDCSKYSGGLMVYVRDNIPSRYISKFTIPNDIQILPFELNLRKRKWLVLSLYKPPSQNNEYFIDNLELVLEYYLACYDDYILIGDFNLQISDACLNNFIFKYGIHSLIKEPTCFKSASNPSCIDLILTNRKFCFQNS